jgi:hypothetical protein
MAVRRELLLILVLLAVIAALVMAIQFFQINVVEADASNFVTEDLHSKYPYADISIMTITPMKNDENRRYFEVKARVTQLMDTPCPERSHIYYNYPAQNFVPQPPEIITRNCQVCAQGICTIAFPEEAIIASHTLDGTEDVESFVNQYQNAVPTVEELSDSWVVTWYSTLANSSYVVTIHRNGTVMDVTEF